MSPIRSWLYVALVCAISSTAIAQQPAIPVSPSQYGSSEVGPSERPAAPLPPIGQQPPLAEPHASGTIGTVTLGELEDMAVKCNPTLAQAANQIEATRGRYVQAGLYPNPVAGYIGSEIGNEGQAGQQGSFVNQEVVTNGKLRLSRNVVQQEIRQAEWAWQSQRQRVLTDVRRSFYEVLVAQRSMELTEQLLRISEEGVRSTESLMKAKEVGHNIGSVAVVLNSARLLRFKDEQR